MSLRLCYKQMLHIAKNNFFSPLIMSKLIRLFLSPFFLLFFGLGKHLIIHLFPALPVNHIPFCH